MNEVRGSGKLVSVLTTIAALLVGPLPAGDENVVAITIARGDKAAFSIEGSTVFEQTGTTGVTRRTEDSRVEYLLEAGERKADGSLSFTVRYTRIKVSMTGGPEGAWTFDSSPEPPADPSPRESYLRGLIGQPIASTVLPDGHVSEIRDYPPFEGSAEASEQGKADPRAPRFIPSVNKSALHRDLERIASRPVQGQRLEKGKAYSLKAGAAAAYGPGILPDRPWLELGGLTYVYRGDEPEASLPAARFELKVDLPSQPDGTQQGTENGNAVVALADGLLLRFELDLELKVEAREGSPMAFTRKVKSVIQRGAAVPTVR